MVEVRGGVDREVEGGNAGSYQPLGEDGVAPGLGAPGAGQQGNTYQRCARYLKRLRYPAIGDGVLQEEAHAEDERDGADAVHPPAADDRLPLLGGAHTLNQWLEDRTWRLRRIRRRGVERSSQ